MGEEVGGCAGVFLQSTTSKELAQSFINANDQVTSVEFLTLKLGHI